MEAAGKSLKFLENVYRIKVPFFQRNYVWGEENWQDLLDELYYNTKSNFLGSLIFKKLPTSTGDKQKVLLIDGQQRLTTLAIITKTLHETFPSNIQENTIKMINRILFSQEDLTESIYEIKIEHSRIDKKYFELIINSKNPEEFLKGVNLKDSKLLECYDYCLKYISKKSESKNKDLFKRLYSQDYKIVVVVDLDDYDDEQNIFDVINNSGLRLSIADTIKNNIFQKLLDLIQDEEKVIKIYENYWNDIFNKDEEAIKYWETIKVTGRLKRTNIEILLHSVAIIENIYDPDKDTLEQLPAIYQEKFKNMNAEELTAFIKTISEYAILYRDKILYLNNCNFSFNDYEKRLFNILDVCDITTFHPYILHVYKSNKDNLIKIQEKLEKLEKFVIRRFIAKKETKSYNKICKEFINDEAAIDNKLLETSDKEVKDGLKLISNKAATLVLFWVELYRRAKDKKYGEKEIKKKKK